MRLLGVLLLAAATLLAQAQPDQVRERDLNYERNAPAPSVAVRAVPRGYALIIGISAYENLRPEENLRFAESDAESIYRVLISQQGGAFAAEDVHKLLGRDATLANIQEAIEKWLPGAANEQDRVVVYFAGHGFAAGDGKGYFAPWDFQPQKLSDTAYPMSRLAQTLDQQVKSRWKVVLVDACRSGKLVRGLADSDAATWDDAPKSLLVFTAAKERGKSYEDANLGTGFGVFSYFLMQGWQGAADAPPCDGVITAEELVEYVRRHVRNYAREHGASQTPVDVGDYDPAMVLGLSPACRGNSTAPELSLGSLVVEANLDDITVYLDEKLVGVLQKGQQLRLPGLTSGVHTVTGRRKGYDPDTKEVTVMPGQERAVMLRMQYPREYKKSALELLRKGEKLLFSRKSSLNPLDIFDPRSQTRDDLLRARDVFQQALKEDARLARAAYLLGMTYRSLGEAKQALAALAQAVAAEPTLVEARIEWAGLLIETGDPDAAVRQLVEALRLEPNNDVALGHLARAYLDKEAWKESREAADRALQARADNEQACLWRADATRHLAAHSPAAARPELYTTARADFRRYLDQTNFNSPMYSQLAFYLVGFSVGRRAHADRQNAYLAQRSIAYLGLCDCELHLQNPLRAADACRLSLKADAHNPISQFLLGNAYRDLFNRTRSRSDLLQARDSYRRMVEQHPDLELANNAKAYLEQIEMILPQVR